MKWTRRNLLKDTQAAMIAYGLGSDDIMYIGLPGKIEKCTWEDFTKQANVPYGYCPPTPLFSEKDRDASYQAIAYIIPYS